MSSRRTLVDTSAWIEVLRIDGDSDLRATVFELTKEGQAVLCDIVRLELWNGARGAAEHRMIRDLGGEFDCVQTSNEVWDFAADLARKCRSKGLTVPATDILIASCARHHGLNLIHADRHFDEIDALGIFPPLTLPGWRNR